MNGFSMPPIQEYYSHAVNNVFEVNESAKRARLNSNLFVDGATVTDQLIVQNTEDDAQAIINGTISPQLTIENPDSNAVSQIQLKTANGSGRLGINAEEFTVLTNDSGSGIQLRTGENIVRLDIEDNGQANLYGTVSPQLTVSNPNSNAASQIYMISATGAGRVGMNQENWTDLTNDGGSGISFRTGNNQVRMTIDSNGKVSTSSGLYLSNVTTLGAFSKTQDVSTRTNSTDANAFMTALYTVNLHSLIDQGGDGMYMFSIKSSHGPYSRRYLHGIMHVNELVIMKITVLSASITDDLNTQQGAMSIEDDTPESKEFRLVVNYLNGLPETGSYVLTATKLVGLGNTYSSTNVYR